MKVRVRTVVWVAALAGLLSLMADRAFPQTTTINGQRTVSSALTVQGTTTTNGALTGTGTVTFEGTTKTVNFEASLPGTCTAPTGSTPGELVFRTSDNTLHACTALNTFTQIGGGAGGGFTRGSTIDLTNSGANDLSDATILSSLSSPDLIQISLHNVSLSGTDTILIQIGDSGGFETTGYDSGSMHHLDTGSFGFSSSSTGFVFRVNDGGFFSAVNFTLTRVDGNAWVCSHSAWQFVTAVGTFAATGGGQKTLSDTLTQVRVIVSGSNTFDSGSAVGLYQ